MMLNPVLRREIKTSLRSYKIYIAIAVYIAFIAAVCYLFVQNSMVSSGYRGFDPQSMIYLYALLCGMQMGLIMITAPALTAGAISGERERQTLDLLLVTKMSAFSIVSGKLLSSIGIVILMTVASLPVFAVIFYFGGVSFINLIGMTFFLIVTSCFAGAVSILLSTFFKSTMISTVASYLILGALCAATWIIYLVYANQTVNGINALPNAQPAIAVAYILLALNPATGFFSMIDTQIGTNFTSDFAFSYLYNNFYVPVPFWVVNLAADAVFTLALLLLAAKFIRLKK